MLFRSLRAQNPNDPKIPVLQSRLEGLKGIISTGKFAEPVVDTTLQKNASDAWANMTRREKRDWAKSNDVPLEDAREEFIKGYKANVRPAPKAAPAQPTTPTPKPTGAAGKPPSVSVLPAGATVSDVKTDKGYEVRDATGKLIGYAK